MNIMGRTISCPKIALPRPISGQKLMAEHLENYQRRMAELEATNQALQTQLAESQKLHQQTTQELQQAHNQLQRFRTQPSEQTLYLVLDNMPEAAFWKDRNSVYLGCNRHFSKAAGLASPEEIIGKTDFDLPWKPEEAEWFRACDRRVMNSDTPELGIIEPQRQADGEQYWIETNKIPLHDVEGTVVGILGTFMEITARIKAENQLKQLNEELEQRVEARTQELQTSEARLQRLAANLPGLIFQFRLEADGSRSFPYVSEGCRDIHELEPDDFLECFDLVHERDRDALEQAIQVSALTLSGFHHEHRIITPSGKLKWVQTIARPEQKSDDAILWDGLIIEVSDRKQAEKEQQRLLSILEATPDIVCVANTEGKHLYLNQAGQTSLEISLEQLDLVDIQACYTPEILEKIETEAIPIAIQTGMWRGESYLRSQSGRVFPVSQVILSHRDEDGNLEFLSSVMRDISDLKQLEAERRLQEQALRSIVQGTATQTGEAFFRACVKHLALALDVPYAVIAEVINDGNQKVGKTLAFWNDSDFGENFHYNLVGTPCFNVVQTRRTRRYNHSVQELFPDKNILISLSAESYVGIPVLSPSGNFLGYISVVNTKPMEQDLELQAFILEIFAARAGAEMERIQVERALLTSTEQVQQQAHGNVC